MSFILGTAGHIDHGKTSLVRALTGIDCDRLHEEKRRGITIELGFAFLDVPGGERIGIVDVPGHERFVRAMTAGAAGMDFVLLVVAADEGVMPQTREHLEICSLLGLRHGLVALTKTDMLGTGSEAADMLELAREDVTALVQGTFLEGAPILPVSSHTGEGVEELRRAVLDLAARLEAPKRPDVFRLPVDRIFTLKGHGTVVTGTVFSGEARVGDDVAVMPAALPARIRAIQSHGEDAEIAGPGRRTSLNLGSVDVEDIRRGDVIAHPGTLTPSTRWLTALTCLSSSPRALRHRTEVHAHHGTRECAARIYLFDRDRLQPGETALAEIRFAEPMTGIFGDRFVIRAFSPLRAVAGGVALIPVDIALKRRHVTPALIEDLLALPTLDDDALTAAQLARSGPHGAPLSLLTVLTGLGSRRLAKALARLSASGLAICWDKEGGQWLHADALRTLSSAFLARAAAFHEREPLRPGMPRGVLTGTDVPPKLAHLVLTRLISAKSLIAEGDILRLATHSVELATDQQESRDVLLGIYRKAGLTPPNLKDALETSKLSSKQAAPLLRILQGERLLIKLSEELYVDAGSLDGLTENMKAWFADHEAMSPTEFKELSGGLSRKYVIALLEYYDRERLTLRVGDTRRWRAKA